MDSVFNLINSPIRGAIFSLALILISILINRNWNNIRFFIKRLSYGIPFIGKSKKLAKYPQFSNSEGWFDGEQELCRDFATEYHRQDSDGTHFDRCKAYLNKMTEVGRKQIPVWGIFLLFVIMMLEGFGFAFILSDYTIPGASVQVQTWGAWAISFLIAIILVWVTHSAGHQLYTNSIIKKIRSWYNLKNAKEDLVPDTKISLEKDELDDDHSNWQQLLNRVQTNSVTVKPTYFMVVIAAILIVVVAIGATYVRNTSLEADLLEQHQTALENSESTSTGTDPFAEISADLPDEVIAAQKEHVLDLQNQKEDQKRSGGQVTFAILATIFVFVQFLGIWVGYSFGFAGRESSLAYKEIKGFKNRESYENHHKRQRDIIARFAQKYLKQLQNHSIRWAKNNNIEKGTLSKLIESSERTFFRFIQQEHRDSLNNEITNDASDKEHLRNQANLNREHDTLKSADESIAISNESKELGSSIDKNKEHLIMLKDKFNISAEDILMAKKSADELGIELEKFLSATTKTKA